jgi:hypothetical protein
MFGLMYGVGLWSLMLELFKSFNLPVIPAQGGAGVSTGVPVACVTISACKQICALQGGIHRAFAIFTGLWIPACAGMTH